MQKSLSQPVTGHRVLFVLDEFAGLKRMPAIENAVAQLAGYGVKLFFVLQSLEQLKGTYKDNWETFLSCAGLKIFFSIEDHFTRKYVSDLVGMAEIIRSTESESEGTSASENFSHGTSRSQNQSHGTSQGINRSSNESTSDSRNTGRNWSTNESKSKGENWGKNWSESEGTSEGRNWSQGGSSGVSYKETSFFGLFKSIDSASVSYSSGSNFSFGGSSSTTFSRSKGGSSGGSTGTSVGSSKGSSEGASQSRSQGISEGENSSTTDSISHGTSETETRSQGTGRSSTKSRNQAIHQRPLLRPEEFGKLFARIDDMRHPAFPGFALVLITGTDPVVVRRCNYYDDAQFIDWFSPHPNHRFEPAVPVRLKSIQPLVNKLIQGATPASGKVRIGAWKIAPHEVVSSGDTLFGIVNVPRDGRKISVHAPCNGKAMLLSTRAKRWPQLDAEQLFLLKHYSGQEGVKTDPVAELREACRRLEIVPDPPRPHTSTTTTGRNPWPAILISLLGSAIVAGIGWGIWWSWSNYRVQTLWTAGILVGVPALVGLVIGTMKASKWLDYEHDIEPETQWKAIGVLLLLCAIGAIVWLTVRYWQPIVESIKVLMGFAAICVVVTGLAKLFGKRKSST